MARSATVFGVAVAAIASCQTFVNETEKRTPAREFNEWEMCEDAGGRWVPHLHSCGNTGAPLAEEGTP